MTARNKIRMKKDIEYLTKEEKINAIQEGIKKAWLQALAEVDLSDLFENGVKYGVYNRMPSETVIRDLIFDGVRQGFSRE